MKTVLLCVGLTAAGLLFATKVVGIAVILWLGRPMEGGFLLRQALYAASFFGLAVWLWEALGREKARRSAHTATKDEFKE
jgi:hypothetical protein